MVTTFDLLPLSQYQVRGAGHVVSQAGEVAVPGFAGPICVATTEAGRFVMARTEVGYDGQSGSFRIGYDVRGGVQREMLMTILAIMPYDAIPSGVLGEFRDWAIKRRVLSAYTAFPTCEWHEVSVRIVHALEHLADWYDGEDCSYIACEGMAGEVQYLDLSDGSFFSAMITKIADACSAGLEACGERISNVKDMVDSALEVYDADVILRRADMAGVGDAGVVDDVVVETELAVALDVPQGLVPVAGVGCVDHQYDGEPAYVDSLYKVAEETANAYVAAPNRFKGVVDPFRHGFCYLMFYEVQDRAAVKAFVAEPVLTEGMYALLAQEGRWKLSREIVSFRMYGTRMHLSYVSGLHQACADDVFRALGAMFEMGRAVNVMASKVAIVEDASLGLLSKSMQMYSLGSGGESGGSGRSSPDDAFTYLSFQNEWKKQRILRFELNEENLRLLQAMFVAVRRYATASVGTTNLCAKGLKAISDYDVGGGKSNSQSHAQLSRAVRGILNASMNEGNMWFAFFSAGKEYHVLFESVVQ